MGILQDLNFGEAAQKAFDDFIIVATTTSPLEVEAVGAGAPAKAAPAAVEAATVKLADATYPILDKLSKIGGETVAPLAGKAVNIAFSGDASKVGKAVDIAVEALDSTNTANIFDVLQKLDVALDAAYENNGLLPPLKEFEGVAKAVAGALGTAPPDKLSALLPAILDASNSADKLKVLGVVGEGTSLVSKIPPADVAAASSAALDLAKVSGLR